MRWSKRFTSVLAGSGLCVTGALVVGGCSKDYAGCEATHTCGGSVEAGGAAGDETPSKGARGGKGGTGGSSDLPAEGGGDSGGKGGSSSSNAGRGGRVSAEGGGAGEDGTPAHVGGKGGGPVASEAGAGGAEPEGASGGGGEGAAAPMTDEEAPHILTTTPANGDRGVRSDAEIRVKFSERMDNASVEAAFHSETLPPVKLLWDNDSTELVIQPSERLVYADGSDPEATAKFYSFTIGGAAQDAAGNAMGDERTFVFTTVRHLQHSLSVPAKWARRLWHPADGSADTQSLGCATPDSPLTAGDDADDAARGFAFAFDLGTLPRGVIEWGKAELQVKNLGGSTLNPFPRLGALEGYVISTPLEGVLWSVPTIGELGAVLEYRSLDHFDKSVLEFAPAAYADGVPFAFFMRFETATDEDGAEAYTTVHCENVSLELEYWAP